MRIALIYPPPWKIAAPGEAPFPPGEGPPRGREAMTLGGDFLGPPYGLLQLDAQARRAGYEVVTLNLATFAWREVERIVSELEADLFGLSCLTANRRGVGLIAETIRRSHPTAHITIGGPHATALPREMLAHHPAIDTVVIGEGEATFLELCAHVADRPSPKPPNLPGTAWRDDDGPRLAPPRDPLSELDQLAPIHRWYPSPFVITSRGCPGRCTFCGSRGVWGKKVRFHSVDRVLDTLETVVRAHGQPLVAIKDDTFSVNRRRVLEICRGVRQRGLRFLWLCDTRADTLDEEVLGEMRLAGCQRISLGVESGSPEILKRLNKRITPETVRRATRRARSFGFLVRWYVILGSPGESFETLDQTLSLIREERPHQVVFTPFSTYPGTPEYELRVERGELNAEVFFERDFWTPTFGFDLSGEVERLIREWLETYPGIASVSRSSVEELRAARDRLPGAAAIEMDLAGALLDAGELEPAERAVARAREGGYPLPEIGANYLACVAAARGEAGGVGRHLAAAGRGYPLRHVRENLERFEHWSEARDARDLTALDLIRHPGFEIAEEMRQPLNPGAIDGIE